MKVKIVQGVEFRQVQRQNRQVLLAPEIWPHSCHGCTFFKEYKRAGSCLVRWKAAGRTNNRHVDCSSDDNDDGVGRIYIERDAVPEYLAAFALAKLEGDDE